MQAKAAVEEGSLVVSQMRISHHFAHKHLLQRWRLSDESGGILWDAVVHPVYLTEHLLGPVTSVYAVARKIKERVFDSFILVLQNRRMGTIDYFWNAKYPLLQLQVLGENGDCYHADLVHDVAVKRSGDYVPPRGHYFMSLVAEDFQVPLARWSRYFQNFCEIRSYSGAMPFERTFFILIRGFLAFLNGNREKPPVLPEEGLRAVRVLEAAKESLLSGQPKPVKRAD